MRIAYFGSGAFGCPTLAHLATQHEICLVVTQPDKPAGRNKVLQPTPVADIAGRMGVPIIKPATVREADLTSALRDARPDALVVIAYGHKLVPELLGGRFAINLHASLLPKYRGAAPIQWAMMNGETETGVSVIELAQRMDAGRVLAQQSLVIDPEETAGELHDRLSALGPSLVATVLRSFLNDSLSPVVQDERMVTKAPKLSRADAWVDFSLPAELVRARVHGLTPWPGCWAELEGMSLRLGRVRDHGSISHRDKPGTVLHDFKVACGSGAIELLEVQAPGGKLMTFDAFRRGRKLVVGSLMTSEPLKAVQP